MRILHLAYEDPAQPGSGGGSVRTREINSRLSHQHEITALVAGYPGAKPRVKNGVHWVPIGPRSGAKIDRLAYFALLGPAIRRHPHDLLVEDFGAPFSVGFSPLFTRKPVVASVQWLFASQMRHKYRLPFDWVERSGLRLYNDFIAVSDWLANALRIQRPDATISTIPNGVEDRAFRVEPMAPQHLLFVGRLDTQQKGCDLLLEIVTRARALLGARMPPLVIVGDGPDREAIELRVQLLGLADKVEFRGRVDGIAKFRLMASAYAVLMPSRFETFGMVAVESQAVGAPVIAFDVGPLAEVAGGGDALLIRPFDLDAFAKAVAEVVTNEELAVRLRHSGRSWARKYDWDEIAVRQEACYMHAVARSRSVRAAAL